MKLFSVLTVLFLFFGILQGQEYKYVNTETLNIRNGPGKDYAIVGKVNKGDKVKTVSESNSWTEIETESGTKGFVSSKFISDQNKKGSSFWINTIILVGFVSYGAYKLKNFFSNFFSPSKTNSSKKETSRPYSTTSKTDTFHLSIRDGVVNLGKERSTMRQSVFNYFDKAIDCDLENPKDERSRFLVVTTKGDVILCQLKSTSKEFVFRPFSSYGSAYKARFTDKESFTFTTEKGLYKGYFKSTRKDKLA